MNTDEGHLILELYKILTLYSNDLDEKLNILNKITLLCKKLPLSEVEDPVFSCAYIDHGNGVFQSTRLPSLFSHDKGLNWYDLDKKPNDYEFWYYFGLFVDFFANFRYSNLFSIPKLKKMICKRKLYFVSFPYVYSAN